MSVIDAARTDTMRSNTPTHLAMGMPQPRPRIQYPRPILCNLCLKDHQLVKEDQKRQNRKPKFMRTQNETETGTTNVVVVQLSIAKLSSYTLFDSGATHSFISTIHANRLDRVKYVISQTFRTSLPLGDVLISTHWLRAIPVRVAERELYVDLIILDMYDYNVIFGMDFLTKYNATIECRLRRFTFKPSNNGEFSFVDENHQKQKTIISSMKARKMLLSGCQGFLASVVDTTQEDKVKPEDIPIVPNFLEVSSYYQGRHQYQKIHTEQHLQNSRNSRINCRNYSIRVLYIQVAHLGELYCCL